MGTEEQSTNDGGVATAADTLTVHVTCTNRDLPARLPFGGERGLLELEGAAPLSRILCR